MLKDTKRLEGTQQSRILHRLIQEKGYCPTDYALFFVVGEGEYLPISTPEEKVEETSGYLIDKRGRVFAFWMDWDAERAAPALIEWDERPVQPDWLRSNEYRRARQRVGLQVA
jgi:hypothetical protein